MGRWVDGDLGTGTRKMPADITKASRSQNRIGDRVQEHVRIRMPIETFIKWNRDAADDEWSASHQRVNIKGLADANWGHGASCTDRPRG